MAFNGLSKTLTIEQTETVKKLAGKVSISEIAKTIKSGVEKTKKEMYRLKLLTEKKGFETDEDAEVEYFDYANEYNYNS